VTPEQLDFVGLICAFSSNAISAGIGALMGGWPCDQVGRKRISQWDLLVFVFGLLSIIFAQEAWMLVVGYGLAVGADVPASWTLITETAPSRRRGRRLTRTPDHRALDLYLVAQAEATAVNEIVSFDRTIDRAPPRAADSLTTPAARDHERVV
jgi:hypothetical protein